jgi:hypothetical protein
MPRSMIGQRLAVQGQCSKSAEPEVHGLGGDGWDTHELCAGRQFSVSSCLHLVAHVT